jgi:drug/metabolite transporter (DMT)-like permease
LSNQSNRTSGYLALATTSILWGTTWVASKVGVLLMPAFQMAAIRQFLGGICFILFFMLYKKLPLPSATQFAFLVMMAVLMFVGANGLSTWSLKYIPTGLSSLIGALYPLSVVIIEMVFFNNKEVSVLTFIGLLLGIGGTGIVFYENAFHGSRPEGFYFGVLLSAGAMLSWSAGTVIIARNKIKIDPYYAIGWQMLISSGMLYIIALASKTNIPVQDIPIKGWMAIFYLVIAGSLISFAAFVYSMKKLPAALFSLYAYFNPLVAMLVAGFLLNERLNINILWGAIVTLLGVFLVNYSMKKSKEDIIAEPEQ